MKNERIFKLILISFFIIIFTGALFFIIVSMMPVPPTEEIEKARKALSEAKKNLSQHYASVLYSEAEDLYESSILYWKKENDKFFLNRDFGKATEAAGMAKRKAIKARNASIAYKNNLHLFLKSEIDSLELYMANFGNVFDNLPLTSYTRSDYQKGKLLLTESKYAYRNKNYNTCYKKVLTASEYIDRAFSTAKSILDDYFKNYKMWVNWSEKTINSSKRNNAYAVIVDKFSKECYVYKDGVLKCTYDVELGKNWIGYKRYRGDNATPEGIYRVTKKIQGPHTMYYKALLLDYPNDEDKDRFKNELRRGTLPRTAQIGDMIEIHGEGGKGINWTKGCIALENNDMDKIFDIAELETQITIVGSLKSLSEILGQ